MKREVCSVRIAHIFCKAGRMLRHSLVGWCEATHQEFQLSINLNAPANIGMQGELTHFPHRVTSRQPVVLPQISCWSRQFPACPAQKKWCMVIIYVQKHTIQDKFWTDFHEICVLDACPHIGELYCFWKQSAEQKQRYGENVPPKPVFWLSFSRYGIFHGENL